MSCKKSSKSESFVCNFVQVCFLILIKDLKKNMFKANMLKTIININKKLNFWKRIFESERKRNIILFQFKNLFC